MFSFKRHQDPQLRNRPALPRRRVPGPARRQVALVRSTRWARSRVEVVSQRAAVAGAREARRDRQVGRARRTAPWCST